MSKRFIVGLLMACVCAQIVSVSAVTIAGENPLAPDEMTLESYRFAVENVAPPICFLAKDLDVNGDGVITEADSKAAKALKDDDPFFVSFDANLRKAWPACNGDKSWKSYKGPVTNAAVKRLIEVLASGLVPAPIPEELGGTPEYVAVVLTKWTGSVQGPFQCSAIEAQALKDLRTRRTVYVFNFKSKLWEAKTSEPVEYFGHSLGSGTT